jgi:hypothetical protein
MNRISQIHTLSLTVKKGDSKMENNTHPQYIGVCTGIYNGVVSGFLLDTKRNVKTVIEHGGRTYVGAQWAWHLLDGLGNEPKEPFGQWLEYVTTGFDDPQDVLNPHDLDDQAHIGIRLDIAPIGWNLNVDEYGNTLIDLVKLAEERIENAHVCGEVRYKQAEANGLQPAGFWEQLGQDENGQPFDPATMGCALLALST